MPRFGRGRRGARSNGFRSQQWHARPHSGPTAIELSEMVTSGCSRSVRPRRLPAPTGLRPKAQGCRVAATLGILATERPTPTGLSQGKRTRRHNPFGVVHPSTRLPRVAPLRGPTLGWRTQPRWGTIGGCSLIQRQCTPALTPVEREIAATRRENTRAAVLLPGWSAAHRTLKPPINPTSSQRGKGTSISPGERVGVRASVMLPCGGTTAEAEGVVAIYPRQATDMPGQQRRRSSTRRQRGSWSGGLLPAGRVAGRLPGRPVPPGRRPGSPC